LRDGSIYQLLTKLEQKTKGFPSPDRADALNLCFWNYKTSRISDGIELAISEEPEKIINPNEKVESTVFDQRDWARTIKPRFSPEHVELQDMEDLREQLSHINKQRNR